MKPDKLKELEAHLQENERDWARRHRPISRWIVAAGVSVAVTFGALAAVGFCTVIGWIIKK